MSYGQTHKSHTRFIRAWHCRFHTGSPYRSHTGFIRAIFALIALTCPFKSCMGHVRACILGLSLGKSKTTTRLCFSQCCRRGVFVRGEPGWILQPCDLIHTSWHGTTYFTAEEKSRDEREARGALTPEIVPSAVRWRTETWAVTTISGFHSSYPACEVGDSVASWL